MAVKVSIEPKSLAQFVEACRQFAKKSGIAMRDALLEQAMLACQDAAKFTPPLAKGGGDGLSARAQKAGEQAVDRDVGKVIAPLTGGSRKTQQARIIRRLGSLALNNNPSVFWKVASKNSPILNDNPFLRKILSDRYNGFGTPWGFKKLQNYFSKIGTKVSSDVNQAFLQDVSQIKNAYMPIYKRNGGRLWKNGKNQSGLTSMTKYIAENKQDITAFVAERQRMVGAVKSGWFKAMQSLPRPTEMNGQKGEPGAELRKATWVTSHSNVAGTSTSSFSEKNADISVTNTIGNINGIADQAAVLSLVYGNRVKQMPAMMRYRMRKPINKFNRK
jgi:hypothetical protein